MDNERQSSLEKFLIDSLMLSSPLISSDPAFQQLSDDIPSILEQCYRRMGKEELSQEEEYLLILYCKLEIYQRLALAVSLEYNTTVEQASFKKGDRFYHYTSLADSVRAEIKDNISLYTVYAKDVTIKSKNGSVRNYNLSKEQEVKLVADNVYSDKIELSWSPFSSDSGGFDSYSLYCGQKPLYDEYGQDKFVLSNAEKSYTFFDIKRTKFRIENLLPNTKYYLMVVVKNRNGAKSLGFCEVNTSE